VRTWPPPDLSSTSISVSNLEPPDLGLNVQTFNNGPNELGPGYSICSLEHFLSGCGFDVISTANGRSASTVTAPIQYSILSLRLSRIGTVRFDPRLITYIYVTIRFSIRLSGKSNPLF